MSLKELDFSRPAQPAPSRTLLTMNRNVFLQLVKTNPEFGVALLTAAAERVRYLSGRVN
jgi:hypothetical protein